MSIAIINYGMGNCGSVLKMLSLYTKHVAIVENPALLKNVQKIVLPGVGAFDKAMQSLKDKGFEKVLDDLVLNKKIPILGICLGMQIMSNASEEGKKEGLGWIPGSFKKFKTQENSSLKIPHMGWNTVALDKSCPLFKNIDTSARFYFAHSYFMEINPIFTVGVTSHGYPFSSAIAQNNIFGVQFHPEKSHRFGMQLINNFVDL